MNAAVALRSIRAGQQVGAPVGAAIDKYFQRQQMLEDAMRQRSEQLSDREAEQQRQDEVARRQLLMEAATKPELGLVPTGAQFERVPGLGNVGIAKASPFTQQQAEGMGLAPGAGMLPRSVIPLKDTGLGVDYELAKRIRREMADEKTQDEIRKIEAKAKLYKGGEVVERDADGNLIIVSKPAGTATPVTSSVTGEPVKGAPKGGAGAQNLLTEDAIDRHADRYNATGELPKNLGRSGVTQAAILNRAAEKMATLGDDATAQKIRNDAYQGLAAELKNLQKVRGPVEAFSRTADKNLTLAEGLSDAVERSDIPMLNKLLMPFGQQVRGRDDIAGLNAAIQVAINETARTLNSATAGGVVSDSARHEIEAIMNSKMNPAQIRRVSSILRQDMKNRFDSYDEQENAIMEQMALASKPGYNRKQRAGEGSREPAQKDPLGLFK